MAPAATPAVTKFMNCNMTESPNFDQEKRMNEEEIFAFLFG